MIFGRTIPAAATPGAGGQNPDDSSLGALDDVLEPGIHDQALQEAHENVVRAEQALNRARDQRARVMLAALDDGYSIYLLGRLTGRRRPTSVHRDLRRFDEPRTA